MYVYIYSILRLESNIRRIFKTCGGKGRELSKISEGPRMLHF